MRRKDSEGKTCLFDDQHPIRLGSTGRMPRTRRNRLFELPNPEEEGDLLNIVTSDLEVDRRSVDLRLSISFDEVADRFEY